MNIEVNENQKLSTSQFINQITETYMTYARKDKIEKHPSIFMLGQPGVGKSQAVQKIASNLRESLNKSVYVKDIRLLLFNPVDLRGIPIANKERMEAIWLKPEVFHLNPSNEVINILFLDELTSAPSSLQAAAYQIALDRKLGEHSIPNNTFVIAAGNRSVDNAIAYEMPTPLRNRFMHFELVIDLEDWIEWAYSANIHPFIINFLKHNPDKFSTKDFDTSSNIIVTPRSWEFLSEILDTMGGDISQHKNLIASVIGVSLTSLMFSEETTILIDDILQGKSDINITNMSDLQRMIDILDDQIENYAEVQDKMKHILSFLLKIPMDYAVRIFRKIISLEISSYDITEINHYHSFLNKLQDED